MSSNVPYLIVILVLFLVIVAIGFSKGEDGEDGDDAKSYCVASGDDDSCVTGRQNSHSPSCSTIIFTFGEKKI